MHLLVFLAACAPPARPTLPADPALPAPPPLPAEAHLWIGGDVHRGTGTGPLLSFQPEGAGIVNLEGPAAPGATVPSAVHPTLFNAPASLAALRAAGVRVAGIVNNHAADGGSFVATANALGAAGIAAAGGRTIASIVVSGVPIAVTAVDLSAGLPADLDAILAAAGATPGPWIATFHTAGPASYLPDPTLRAAVDRAVAAGADVVAVHGSHLAGPVERRGAAVIAWGLGNVGFACDCTRETEAVLLEVTLPSGAARVRPIAAGLHGAPATAAPDAAGIYDLLDAIGSTALDRAGDTAVVR